jgi:hypothetical protein
VEVVAEKHVESYLFAYCIIGLHQHTDHAIKHVPALSD